MAVHAISQRHVDGLAGADDQPVARTFDGVQPAAPGPVHVAQSRDPKHVEYPWMALSEWTFGCPVSWRGTRRRRRRRHATRDAARNPDDRRSALGEPTHVLLYQIHLERVDAVDERRGDAKHHIDARRGRHVVRQGATAIVALEHGAGFGQPVIRDFDLETAAPVGQRGPDEGRAIFDGDFDVHLLIRLQHQRGRLGRNARPTRFRRKACRHRVADCVVGR